MPDERIRATDDPPTAVAAWSDQALDLTLSTGRTAQYVRAVAESGAGFVVDPEALARRVRQLEAVHAVSQEITKELDLSTLLLLIVRRALELVQAGAGLVHLWDEETQRLVPREWTGCEGWTVRVPLWAGEDVPGAVALRREGLIVNDYRTSPYATGACLARSPLAAVLSEPLLYQDRLLGVITIGNEGSHRPFTPEDREVLALFAHQAAIAIENARLHERLAARLTRLQALTRLTQLISSSLDVDAVLHEIVCAAATLMNAPFVSFWMADEAEQTH
jgi:GAF domain-containing protein